VYCKGAPDMLWDHVSKVVTESGQIVDINDEAEIPKELLSQEPVGTKDTYLGIYQRTVK
jgi:hypothetical protein